MIGSTSSESSPASEEVIASNEDLLIEILRFKSVSKNWLNLISDSHFALNHSRRIRNSSMISCLFFYYDYSRSELHSVSLHAHPNLNLPTLSFLDDVGGDHPFWIRSACNGLILCQNYQIVCNRFRKKYVVCNPTTQKFTLLPQLDCLSLLYESLGDYLAFNPSKSPRYKVVFFQPCYQFDIYSSETASWKQITVGECEPLRDCLEGVFWNGAIHWLSHEDVHFRFDVDDRSRRYTFRELCVVKGVSENDFALVLATTGKVVYYDLKGKTSRVLLDHLPLLNFHASIFHRYPCSQTYQFVESLSPV